MGTDYRTVSAVSCFHSHAQQSARLLRHIPYCHSLFLHTKTDICNLQPLHWDNNVAKGEGLLVCKVTANGIHNTIVPHWDVLLE